MSARTMSWTVIENTAAALAANTTIFGRAFALTPSDTADAGKHKLCNGVNTYAELSFIEDNSGGSGITALTGDVTASGTGSVVATIGTQKVATAMIQNNAVTDGKLATMSESTLKGRGQGGGAGNPQGIALGAGLSMSGQTLSVTANQVYVDDALQANTVTRVYNATTDTGVVTGTITGITTLVFVSATCAPDAGDSSLLVTANNDSSTAGMYSFKCKLVDGSAPTDGTAVKVIIIGIP